jgi:hypothetical protein
MHLVEHNLALSEVVDSIAELQGGKAAVNVVFHGLQFLGIPTPAWSLRE